MLTFFQTSFLKKPLYPTNLSLFALMKHVRQILESDLFECRVESDVSAYCNITSWQMIDISISKFCSTAYHATLRVHVRGAWWQRKAQQNAKS